jgi:hypothetical protein
VALERAHGRGGLRVFLRRFDDDRAVFDLDADVGVPEASRDVPFRPLDGEREVVHLGGDVVGDVEFYSCHCQ